MPMEPMYVQCCRPTGSRRCVRCGSDRVRELGPQSPSIEWLACMECRHVWARTLLDSLPTGVLAESVVAGRAPSEHVLPMLTKSPGGTASPLRVRLRIALLTALHWAESLVWSRQPN
jgi:hypothetical protein